MKTVLILLGNEFSANGICVSHIVKTLNERGYRVLCFADDAKGSPVISGTEIVRLKPPHATFNKLRERHPGKLSDFLYKLRLLIKKAKLLFLYPIWPVTYPIHTKLYQKAAEKLAAKQNVDCVISVFFPIEALIAGHQIKKKHPEIKFIAYFLDSLSGGSVPRLFSRDSSIRRGLKWERRLLRYADRIVYMESSRAHHEIYSADKRYYSRVTFLDIPMFAEQATAQDVCGTKTALLDKTKINLIYAGSLAPGVREPGYFLEVFSKLPSPDLRLTLIIPHPYRLPAPYSQDLRISVFNSIAHDQVLSVFEESDILINLGNRLASLLPSKIFEYMSAGKPIVSTLPIENEPCVPYLKEYPLCLFLSEYNPDLERDARSLEKFIIETKGRSVDPAAQRGRLSRNTPEALAELISEVLSE